MATKHLQLLRKSGFTSAADAKQGIETAFASGKFLEGEPVLATYSGETVGVVLGIKSDASTHGSVFYNAATVDGLIAQLNSKIGDLANLGTNVKTSIVAAINELVTTISSLDASDIAYTTGATDTIVTGATNVDKAIKALDTAVADIQTSKRVYELSAVTPSSTSVKEEYALMTKVGDGEWEAVSGSANVKVYKDSALYSVYIGHVDDTITSPTNPEVVPGSGDTAMCFIYMKDDQTYTIVTVNIESYLSESEFKDGLQVVNHEVSVKLDNEAGSDSAKFLYMKKISGGNGAIALSGITDAIDTAADAATTVVAEGTDAGNNMSIVETADNNDGHKIFTINLSDVASATGLTAEVTARRAQTGISGDVYTANAGTIISGATSLNSADVILAGKVAELEAAKVKVVKDEDGEDFLTVTESQDKTTYTIKIDGVKDMVDDKIAAISATTVAESHKFVSDITQTNGVISVTMTQPTAADIDATAISADGKHVGVTGTTVEAQIKSISETLKTQADAALTGVTSANAAIAVGTAASNSQELTFKLDTTTATNNITSDMLDVTSNGLRMKDVFDCGTWS